MEGKRIVKLKAYNPVYQYFACRECMTIFDNESETHSTNLPCPICRTGTQMQSSRELGDALKFLDGAPTPNPYRIQELDANLRPKSYASPGFEPTPKPYLQYKHDWQNRVVEERRELYERLGKLEIYTKGETFKVLTTRERKQLRMQLHTMQIYLAILEDRIANFHD